MVYATHQLRNTGLEDTLLYHVTYKGVYFCVYVCVCRFQRDSTELEEWMSCAHERVQKWNSFSDSAPLDSRVVFTQLMVTRTWLVFISLFFISCDHMPHAQNAKNETLALIVCHRSSSGSLWSVQHRRLQQKAQACRYCSWLRVKLQVCADDWLNLRRNGQTWVACYPPSTRHSNKYE